MALDMANQRTSMPVTSVQLKAGWYAKKTATIYQVSGDSHLGGYDEKSITMKNGLTLDMSAYLPNTFTGTVKIQAYLKICQSSATLSSPRTVTLYFYSADTISDNYLLYQKEYKITSKEYAAFDYSFTANINSNKIYGAEKISTSNGYAYISDYYFEVTYPDTANLYL